MLQPILLHIFINLLHIPNFILLYIFFNFIMNVCERSYKSTFTSRIESNIEVGGVQV